MYLSEYLPRLSTISTVIDFPHDVSSINGLSTEHNNLVIKTSAQNDPIVIHLPNILDRHRSKLQLTNLKKTNDSLIISLKVDSHAAVDNFMTLLDSQLWSCKDLLKTPKNRHNVNEFRLLCEHCQTIIIDSVAYSRFSDMPSSLWVEMMDFWHCHKPHDTNSEKSSKDFNGDLVPTANGILIGNYYFLIREDDANMNVLNVSGADIKCSCGHILGEKTPKNCMKLYKWSLKLSYNDSNKVVHETYPAYMYVYNILLDKINSQAIRKLLINNHVIWIFNIGQNITVNGVQLTNSLKILYYQLPKTSGVPIFDDEITLEENLFYSFLGQLKKINDGLPDECKKMSLKENEKVVNYRISYLGI